MRRAAVAAAAAAAAGPAARRGVPVRLLASGSWDRLAQVIRTQQDGEREGTARSSSAVSRRLDRDGALLVYENGIPARHWIGSAVAVLPAVFGATQMYLNLSGAALEAPSWTIWGSFTVTGILVFISYRTSALEVQRVRALPGGQRVEITPTPTFGLFRQPPVTIPVTMFGIRSDSPAMRVLAVAPPEVRRTGSPGALMVPMDKGIVVPDTDVFEDWCNGRTPLPVPAPPGDTTLGLWRTAADPKGRTYWWHEVTRERRWMPPPSA